MARGWVHCRWVDQSEEGDAESVRVQFGRRRSIENDEVGTHASFFFFVFHSLRPKELRKICRQLSGWEGEE